MSVLCRMLVFAILSLLTLVPANAQRQHLATVERRLMAAYRHVRRSVVRIESEVDGRMQPIAQGVIISSDGLVATLGKSKRESWEQQSLTILLPDGNRVAGRALGWSQAWRIGLVRIDADGPWPFVEMGRSNQLREGQICFALDYASSHWTGEDQQATVRFGAIKFSGGSGWFVSSCEFGHLGGFGAGTFDLDGRLIGLTTRRKGDELEIQTGVDILRRMMDELVAGVSADDQQLRSAKRPDVLATLRKPNDPLETAKSASVRIRHASTPNRNFSGTIVDESGLILTCAHHRHRSGETLTVELPDGRDVNGKILGTNWVSDTCLIQLTGQGPWPHVAVGSSFGLDSNSEGVVMGYPCKRKERAPLVRKTQVTEIEGLRPCCLLLTLSGQTLAGTSGGGVFNRQAQLVAVHSFGARGTYQAHVRVETFFCPWNMLSAKQNLEPLSSNAFSELTDAYRMLTAHVVSAIVEIRAAKERIGYGTVVSSNGTIVTKASELGEPLTCRLSDGREFAASSVRVSREHDLATLNIDATDLPAVDLPDVSRVSVGQLAAAVIPDREPVVGAVAHDVQPLAREDGRLPSPDSLRDTDHGLELIDDQFVRMARLPLQKGDVIRHVNDKAAPSREAFARVTGWDKRTPFGIAGDPVIVGIRRAGKEFDLRFPTPGVVYPRLRNTNPRSSGFPIAFDMAIPLMPKECGAPVIDTSGHCVGIVIARRTRGGIYILPSRIVKEFVSASE